MPILGLVLTLDLERPELREAALSRLAAWPGLDLGEIQDAKQPAVLDLSPPAPGSKTETSARRSLSRKTPVGADPVESEIDALREIPGVAYLDVVFAEFGDLISGNDAEDTSADAEQAGRALAGPPLETKSWT